MNRQSKIIFSSLFSIALLTIVLFGSYWFEPRNVANNFTGWWHMFDVLLFAVATYVVWMPILMKIGFWSIASHIKQHHYYDAHPGLKVAFITTFVPASESIDLLHKTLPAMVNAKYPHDTWLLDEGNDPEVREICEQYGVRHFSRHGLDHYNAADGKFAKKTKGGNHNSWYDNEGNDYDVVAQIDTDFLPDENFLTKTLGYFRDPRVAFVGTPQIYGNTHESIIAKGAAQQTYNFYGPLLRGMAGMDSTMLIGANHVIRVAALKQVDHYSAHITEDLLTGMKLHAKGWKSVYVPEALAVGEGPITWKSYFAQQKRWAYGCMHILFNHSFKLFRSMSARRVLYYFIIQQHYFGGIAQLLSVACLVAYFSFGFLSTDMELNKFLLFYACVIFTSSILGLWLQRFNIRPDKEKGIMWAGMYINIAAWPIYFMAFLNLFKAKKMAYKVTPKGKKVTAQPMPVLLFTPHITLALITFAAFFSSFYSGQESVIMRFWALTCGVTLLIAPLLPFILSAFQRLPRPHKVRA